MSAAPLELRPYQLDVIERIRRAMAAGKRRVLLVAPTGSGKTIIATAIVNLAAERRSRVLFLAHRRELIAQASSKLHAIGLDHGLIQAGFPTRPGEPLRQNPNVDLTCATLSLLDELGVLSPVRGRDWGAGPRAGSRLVRNLAFFDHIQRAVSPLTVSLNVVPDRGVQSSVKPGRLIENNSSSVVRSYSSTRYS